MGQAQQDTELNAPAIKEIERLAGAARKTSVLKAEDERAGVYYLVDATGKAVKTLADPEWHNEKLGTPLDLKAFIANRAPDNGAVFYSDSSIVYVENIDDRRDLATCELKITPQYAFLAAGGAKTVSQSDFVRLLRISFNGCLGSDSNLLPLVRNLKFSSGGEAAGNIQHGRESLGKQITASVSGESSIPEEVVLDIPIFENHTFRTRVACAIEVFPHEQRFSMVPYPLATRKAMDEALADITFVFAGEGIPSVYRGQP